MKKTIFALTALLMFKPYTAYAEKYHCATDNGPGPGKPKNQTRVGIEIKKGLIQEFAFYTNWGGRTCSLSFVAGDAKLTGFYGEPKAEVNEKKDMLKLKSKKGEIYIQKSKNEFKVVLKDVDAKVFCGMSGVNKINGEFTLKTDNTCKINDALKTKPSLESYSEEGSSPNPYIRDSHSDRTETAH